MANVPPDVLSDVNRHAPFVCEGCGHVFSVLDAGGTEQYETAEEQWLAQERDAIDQLRRDLAASRAECERLRGAMEHAQWIIGKGRCTCAESEGAMHVLSAALAAPATPAAGAGGED